MMMLYCLQCQTSHSWTAHVIADGDYKGFDDVKKHFEKVEKIKFSKIDGPNKDWGHTPRNYGLKNLTQEWVVMTGQDNYYAPTFVEKFLNAANQHKNTNIIFCDMIHNHRNWTLIKTQMKRGEIDMGCFMTRSQYASQLQIDTKSYGGDWLFISEYVKKFPSNLVYIPCALYVHN